MIGLIILAAGQSSRLGQPKQLLQYQGESLIKRTIKSAIASVCDPVLLITGAFAETIIPEIEDKPLQVIHNRDWNEGMASSIRVGVAHLAKDPNIEAVMIMLCDQPFADTLIIDNLIAKRKQCGKGIIASFYSETNGVPILFDKKYFSALLTLKGQEGAKKLLPQYADDVETMPFPLGDIDIDTMEDYQRLSQMEGQK